MKESNHMKVSNYKKIVFVISVFLCAAITSSAQSTKKLADEYIAKYLSYINDSELFSQLKQKPEHEVIEAFADRLNDSVPLVRRVSLQTISNFGSKSTDSEIRHLAVQHIIKGLDDEDVSIVGVTAEYLTEFDTIDFDAENKYIINRKIRENTSYLSKLILISGWLNIRELMYNYRQMISQSEVYDKKERWNMYLAMARMGDADALHYIMQKIKSVTVNDDIVYEIYPDLAYTRQKQAFDFLLEKIMSDSKDCLSSNPDNEAPIICAYRIMEYVGPYITDFPLEIDTYGELIIVDYEDDLLRVRNWIENNKVDYEIIKDKY